MTNKEIIKSLVKAVFSVNDLRFVTDVLKPSYNCYSSCNGRREMDNALYSYNPSTGFKKEEYDSIFIEDAGAGIIKDENKKTKRSGNCYVTISKEFCSFEGQECDAVTAHIYIA